MLRSLGCRGHLSVDLCCTLLVRFLTVDSEVAPRVVRLEFEQLTDVADKIFAVELLLREPTAQTWLRGRPKVIGGFVQLSTGQACTFLGRCELTLIVELNAIIMQ